MGSGILDKESIDLINKTEGHVVQLGPIISIYTLPKDVFVKMKKIVKTVLNSDKSKKHNHKLAGRIDKEYVIPQEMLVEVEIYNYLYLFYIVI